MNSRTKQIVAGGVCVICALIMMSCISRMMPYALSGDVGKAMLWFVLAMIALAASLPFGIAYHYYRSRKRDQGLERMHIEVDTLAHAGHEATRPKPAYPELDQPQKGQKKL